MLTARRRALPAVCAALAMENIEESCPLRITPTVRALSSALRGKRDNVPANGGRLFPEPEKLWFKESSAKNLRTRDFLSPTTMLNTLYADGQVGGEDTCWVWPLLNVDNFRLVVRLKKQAAFKKRHFVLLYA